MQHNLSYQYLEGYTQLAKKGNYVLPLGMRLVYENGRTWKTSIHEHTSPMGECYKNAHLLSLSMGWTYCEGWAMSVIPMKHAWCVNDKQEVVDPTWTDGTDYCGVGFPPSIMHKFTDKTGLYGILPSLYKICRGMEYEQAYEFLLQSIAKMEPLCL